MFLIRSLSVNRPPTSAFTFGAFSYNLQQITMAKLLIGSEKVKGDAEMGRTSSFITVASLVEIVRRTPSLDKAKV